MSLIEWSNHEILQPHETWVFLSCNNHHLQAQVLFTSIRPFEFLYPIQFLVICHQRLALPNLPSLLEVWTASWNQEHLVRHSELEFSASSIHYHCTILSFAVARRDEAQWSIWYDGKTEHNHKTIFDLWSFSKAQRLQDLWNLPVRVEGGSTTWVIMNWRCLGDFQTERYV